MGTAPAEYQTVVEPDDVIAETLKAADLPALLMAVVHLTGDESVLREDIRPRMESLLNGAGDGLDESQRQKIRDLALKALVDYRDRGSPPLAPLPHQTLERMVRFIGGAAISDHRFSMLLENAGLVAVPAYERVIGNPAALQDFSAVIIGAGMAGMLAAIKLDEMGVNYTILEKNPNVAGTWYSNSYPGCRVDIPSHFYSYSFEPNPDWPGYYSERDDIKAYFDGVATKYRLDEKVQFEREVVEATWSEPEAEWVLTVRDRDGSLRQINAPLVISAVGTLSRPKFPKIDGIGDFKGPTTHTFGYDRSIDVKGKRVAVIGSAASAIQAVPHLAAQASHLTVFQRTAQWLFPIPDYEKKISPEAKWMFRHIPYYAKWYRLSIFARVADGQVVVAQIDPEWPDQDRSCSKSNDDMRIKLTKFIKDEMVDRPELIPHLIPRYPPFANRILPNDGKYFKALLQPNVSLITTSAKSADATGIIDSQGYHHDADVIVFATGYEASRYLGPMKVTGRSGHELSEYWGSEARAYLGLTVPNFPNFFMMWGPGTSSGNMIFIAETQMRYISQAIRLLVDGKIGTIECKKSKYDEYIAKYIEAIDRMACSASSVSSWWKAKTGRVVTALPWDVAEYWHWTRTLDLADYVVTPAADRTNSTWGTSGEQYGIGSSVPLSAS